MNKYFCIVCGQWHEVETACICPECYKALTQEKLNREDQIQELLDRINNLTAKEDSK